MPRHLEEKKNKEKPLSCRWGRPRRHICVSAVGHGEPETSSTRQNMYYFCNQRLLWILIKKYFGPRLSEICIFFYYEMKNNRDALS